MSGEVVAFDEGTGLGEVRAEDGATYTFHCTELVDGSRSTRPGATVEFVAVPGHLGRWEARHLSAN